ncbi:RNA-binding protein [Candidatus Micrarchaeota archaeon]|nr:RNA-binding protein [Candidatus Micrarchaeota archaeon]
MEDEIIMPGTQIADKPLRLSYGHVENEKTYSTVLGLKREDKLIPLKGIYEPRFGDYIIGVVSEVKFSGYDIEMKTPYPAFVPDRMLREKLDHGEVIFAKVMNVNEIGELDLGQVKVLKKGRIIEVPAVKIPRVIGRDNSMITLIRESTDCSIFVGKNGFVWISEKGNSALAISAIRKIVREAHTSGLTDKMQEYLKNSN